jgi:hypothetical protein
MPRIISNEELLLLQVLDEHLPHTKQLDASVGYFNLRGWSAISDGLKAMKSNPNYVDEPERVRLLVGMAVNQSEANRRALSPIAADEPPQISRAVELARAAVKEFAAQLTWGIPTDQDKASIQALLADLKSGFLKIKFYTRNPLHAKLYICHLHGGAGNMKAATVGSSNFTPSGLARNGELNLEETDAGTTAQLFDIFKNWWHDNFSVDITSELIEVIENSWAIIEQPSPRLVHLRLAYELSRDARAGKNLDIPDAIAGKLTKWQDAAVRVATRMISTKGIAVIGDVVGLGKTLVGTAIAASYGESVLVISPKNLTKMWEEHLSTYHVPGRVVSLSDVHKVLPELRPFKLVLVDESHNMRHTTRRDWKAVNAYIQSCGADVVLLTATMFNAHHSDISSQLKLKITEDQDLGIRPEELLSKLGDNGEIELAQKTQGRLSSIAAFDQSEEAKDWQRLLGQYLIRRTRKYLKETYGKIDESTGKIYFEFNDGTRFSFPERKAVPLEYVGGPNDPGDRLASIENFDALANMKYARYQPGRYLNDNISHSNEIEKGLIEDMRRGKSTSGFIRTTVLKRLASSPMAFFITLEKMLLRAQVLKYAIDQKIALPIGTLDDRAYEAGQNDDLDIESDTDQADAHEDSEVPASWARNYGDSNWAALAKKNYEKLVAEKPRGLRWANPEWFNLQEFAKDLISDIGTLQSFVDNFGGWKPQDDSKLKALADRINALPNGEKLLVFSEYKDTIDYVFEHMKKMCPGVEIGSVSGSSSLDPTEMARRFSPVSNADLGGLPAGKSELQVLLATDVLSEGQNLQDSALILNWDLPWTIIKIIQRAGRVDRIGQKSDTIQILSFLPHEGVDDRIRLIRRLADRLKTNQDIFGGAEEFFRTDLNDENFDIMGLYTGGAALDGEEGEVDYGSYALGIWDSANQDEREKALKLPVGMSTTKPRPEGGPITLVHTKIIQKDSTPVDLLARLNVDDSITTITQLEALKITASEPGEIALEANLNHLNNVRRIVAESITPQATQTRVIFNHGIRHSIYSFLTGFVETTDVDAITRSQIDDLLKSLAKAPLYMDSEASAREALRARHKKGDLFSAEALLALFINGELLDLSTIESPELEVTLSFGFGSE